jgi:hypothetical protein
MAETARNPVDRVIDALHAAGCNPKQTGNRWAARCPAHDDHSPSLSVTPSETGNVLVYCHRGCTTPEVASALGLRMADLFPPRPPPTVIPMGGIKATYTYCNADGEITYQVVRSWPKTFKQRRPNGKGGWINNVDGVQKIPYLLPQVLKAVDEGKPIWICEGEKDAENVQWWGHVGTTNSGGGCQWNEHCTDAVAGAAAVAIIADRDAKGYNHARMVAHALLEKVGQITIYESDRGKDLTEHQAKGGLAKDLVVLWTSTNPNDWLELTVEPERNPLLGLLVNWAEFWATDRLEEAWLAYPLLPEGRSIALYAPAKAGKSTITVDIALALATGRPILGGTPSPARRVLYLDYEMTEADLQEHLFNLGYGPDDDLTRLSYALLPSLPPLDTAEGAKAVCELAQLVDADLVVVDTFGRAVEGDEDKADTIRAFYRWTGLALKAAGRTVLRMDHAGKDLERGQRGSSAKNDDVDVVWQLSRRDGGAILKRTHSRVSWVPVEINLRWHEENERYTISDTGTYPEGTRELVADIDALGLPHDAGRPTIRKALKEAGIAVRNGPLSAAVRWRKEAGTASGTGTYPQARDSTRGNGDGDTSDLQGQTQGQQGTATPDNRDTTPDPYKGSGCPSPPQNDPNEPIDERELF